MTETLTLNIEMVGVMVILLLTICLFAFEIVRVDVAAVSVMVLIGLTALIPGYDGLVSPDQLFSGYSSNAVISIMAVMIIGAGLDRTGLMGQLAGKILRHRKIEIIAEIEVFRPLAVAAEVGDAGLDFDDGDPAPGVLDIAQRAPQDLAIRSRQVANVTATAQPGAQAFGAHKNKERTRRPE